MATEEEVRKALEECYDPHIPINIVDLGLIYGIETEGNKVNIQMTLTTPSCPMAGQLSEQAKQKVLELDSVDEVDLELVFDPPWSQDMISEKARAKLSDLGFM
ncbi:MAG: metal-sulfur cluster assembly factor [bacterium]